MKLLLAMMSCLFLTGICHSQDFQQFKKKILNESNIGIEANKIEMPRLSLVSDTHKQETINNLPLSITKRGFFRNREKKLFDDGRLTGKANKLDASLLEEQNLFAGGPEKQSSKHNLRFPQ